MLAARCTARGAWLRPAVALLGARPRSGSWRGHAAVAPASPPGGKQRRPAAPLRAASPAVADAAVAADAADPERKRAGKRKVALHIGYEGTEYRGLQMQAATAPTETVEDALEEAIFKAGGILESNRGQLSKVSWSRSSRTDKSVHSLATVVAMKMEVDPDSFERDPEGQGVAAAINAHLPPEVRVFSVQRVSKSWNARSECIRRSYNYYVPASILGLRLDGGEGDAARLALLRAAWERFQGTHPFHNYTKRRLYRDEAVHGDGRRKGRRDGRGGGGADGEDASAGSSSEGEEEETGTPEASSSGGSSGAKSEGALSSSDVTERPRGQLRLEWKAEKDAADLVVRRHFRFIEWCRADVEPKALVPGGQPCVLLSLSGGSFMLHQIRHMVGAAVAVARGHLPLELVDASLATPARVNLPLAPPSTLMLMGAQFSPFRKSWSGQAASAAQWTGEALELREGGQAARQAFLDSCMLPALDGLLAGEEWRQWEADLERMHCDPDQLAALLATHAAWRQQRVAAKLEGALREAAAQEHRDG